MSAKRDGRDVLSRSQWAARFDVSKSAIVQAINLGRLTEEPAGGLSLKRNAAWIEEHAAWRAARAKRGPDRNRRLQAELQHIQARTSLLRTKIAKLERRLIPAQQARVEAGNALSDLFATLNAKHAAATDPMMREALRAIIDDMSGARQELDRVFDSLSHPQAGRE
jgi:hypothetical protein